MTRARAREEHLQIIRVRLPKSFEPFFDKADRNAESGSELWTGPLGMLESQMAKGRTLSDPLSFHNRNLLANERNHQTTRIDPTRR